MRIKTSRPLHFRHNYKEFMTKGGKRIDENAPDWITCDPYFAMAENVGILQVLPSTKAIKPRPFAPIVVNIKPTTLPPLVDAEIETSDVEHVQEEGDSSEAVTLDSINAMSWQHAFKVVAALEDKALLKDIAENAKFESVKKAANDRLISLGD